jgi:hypothetical protein
MDKIFYKVHVVTEDDLDMFSEETFSNVIELNPNNYDWDYDYTQMALIDIEESKVLLWNDNIHTDIENEIDNFIQGFMHSGSTCEVVEKIMLDDDIVSKYSGKRY